ncbi:MAG: GNAT family N-acetyltransferase [Ponticaulis sp.]|nr:GNAT family N-acetyltransferase [Ponticaulis sp.]|tara:strand:- start:2138 stop:2647 length:510 start_codon:yes stop_codon:yes gene_type:complete
MQENFSIRPAETEDIAGITCLNDLAFGQPDEGELVHVLIEDGDDLLSLVATTPTGEIIGHIQFFPIDCVPASETVKFAGLGPMSVHPRCQKAGIGGTLITEGLAQMKAKGIQRVFVLGHKDYYPKFGFDVAETAGYAAPWGGPYFMALTLNPGGPEAGQLIYPDAFGSG